MPASTLLFLSLARSALLRGANVGSQFLLLGCLLCSFFGNTLRGADLATADSALPISLHPANPHYFIYRGRPTVLITSGEHYGAVLNLDFNYQKYLQTLSADGLNMTRVFSGAYVEPAGAFNITSNVLAPRFDRFLCPWKRSEDPGYAMGGNKFDLNSFNPSYFKRLKDFLRQAQQHGIVVEYTFFCPMYEDSQWKLSPQNAANNVNNVGNTGRTNIYTLDRNAGLLRIQEELVRKVVAELNEFPNLLFEICNEPYFGGVTLEWQRHIAAVITEAEKALPHRHLITQNIANGKARIQDPDPAVSVFNFHYASPPETVGLNYALNRVIGDNETGFKGTNDTHYRMEGWEFILAGGALYNNLDYSFVAGFEDGTFLYPAKQPGGGNPVFRQQLRHLKQFIERFDFVLMKPEQDVIQGGLPEKGHARVLAESGRQYAIYLFGGPKAELQLKVPAGDYMVEWLNPITGKITQRPPVSHPGGMLALASPDYSPDIALSIRRDGAGKGAPAK